MAIRDSPSPPFNITRAPTAGRPDAIVTRLVSAPFPTGVAEGAGRPPGFSTGPGEEGGRGGCCAGTATAS